jgi:hypothetical protein
MKVVFEILLEKGRDNYSGSLIFKSHPSTSLSSYSMPSLGIGALSFSKVVFRILLLGLFSLFLIGCQSVTSNEPLQMAPSGWLIRPGSPSNYLNGQLRAILPDTPGGDGKRLFRKYQAKGQSWWEPHWALNLDFTGVAWDSAKAGTLIHPQYMVFASHFQRRLGEEVIFHDRQGLPVRRKIVSKSIIYRIQSPDVTVAKLDSPVPSRITHYPLLPMGHDYRVLNGASLLVTDKERQVHLFRINRVSQQGFEQIGSRPALEHEFGYAWQERLEKGDSGHPAFLVVKGQLVMVSTLKGGGWASSGPFFGGVRLQTALIAAIAKLNTEES